MSTRFFNPNLNLRKLKFTVCIKVMCCKSWEVPTKTAIWKFITITQDFFALLYSKFGYKFTVVAQNPADFLQILDYWTVVVDEDLCWCWDWRVFHWTEWGWSRPSIRQFNWQYQTTSSATCLQHPTSSKSSLFFKIFISHAAVAWWMCSWHLSHVL